jgi:hypothetical protein
MALKRKTRKSRKSRKYKTIRKIRKIRKTKCHTRRRVISGGNYERDITTRTTYGIATKPANKFVAVVPGYGVMSGAAFLKLKEDLDRSGDDFYA